MRRALWIAICAGWLAASPGATDELPEAQALGPALEAFLREQAPADRLRIELPPLDGLERAGAGRKVRFSLHPNQPVVGAVPVGVSLFKDGVLEQKTVVTAQVVVARPVLVARRTLPGGTLLTAEDLALEERALASPHADTLSDPAHAVAHKLRRSVRSGEPLRAALLRKESAVRRGDRVKLRLQHGPLIIETHGRAEEPGDSGQWIRVRNLSSQREVVGRIGDDGVVHVEL